MSLPHASSGQLIDVRPLGNQLSSSTSRAILKTAGLELMRMVLQAGKSVQEHQVPGEITIQCLEGRVEVTAHGNSQLLRAGDMMYLQGGVPHALHAPEATSLLVTILLEPAK